MDTFLEQNHIRRGKNDELKCQGECSITGSGAADKITKPRVCNNRRDFLIGCVNGNISKRKASVSIKQKIVT